METTANCLPKLKPSPVFLFIKPTRTLNSKAMYPKIYSVVTMSADELDTALYELQEFCETLMGETVAVEELFGTTKEGLREKFIVNHEKLFIIIDRGDIATLQQLAEAALLNHADLAQDFFVELQQDERQTATFFDLLEDVALAASTLAQ